MRNIHAILSESENKKADEFCLKHFNGGIEHVFCNTETGAEFRIRCRKCGSEEDLTDFNTPLSERGLIQNYEQFMDFAKTSGFEITNIAGVGLVIVLGKPAGISNIYRGIGNGSE